MALRAHRHSDEARWTASQVLCGECIPRFGNIGTATLGMAELSLTGRLALLADAAEQTHFLTFEADAGESAVLDYASPDEGESLDFDFEDRP